MVKSISDRSKRVAKPEIPSSLIREVIEGQIFYYKDYQSVLNKTKTIEEIMATSTLQSLIINYLQKILLLNLDEDLYHVFASETGVHLSKKVNYGLDLVVFDVDTLPFEKIDDHYANVLPQLVIEVDVKVDTKNLSEEEFIQLKTNSLLKHGAAKVIWVSSKTKKILIAEKDKDWASQSWYAEFEMMDGLTANVGEYLRGKGVPAALD